MLINRWINFDRTNVLMTVIFQLVLNIGVARFVLHLPLPFHSLMITFY